MGILNHPKWIHFWLIVKFFFFKFLLSALDVFTDILAAKEFFVNGNTYWGMCTALLVFAPFAARVIQTTVQAAMCIRVKMVWSRSRPCTSTT